jgi:hypothetical protein
MLRAVCQEGGSLRWPALAKRKSLPLVPPQRWRTTGALEHEHARIVDHSEGRVRKYKVVYGGVPRRWGGPRKDADDVQHRWLTAEALRASPAGVKLIEEYHSADTRKRKQGGTVPARLKAAAAAAAAAHAKVVAAEEAEVEEAAAVVGLLSNLSGGAMGNPTNLSAPPPKRRRHRKKDPREHKQRGPQKGGSRYMRLKCGPVEIDQILDRLADDAKLKPLKDEGNRDLQHFIPALIKLRKEIIPEARQRR